MFRLKPGDFFMSESKIKAVLFDMDGVLIDARDWHYEALNKALRLFGLEISRFDHLHSFDGLPTKEKLRMLEEDNYFPEELHSFVNQLKQKYTMEYIQMKCIPTFSHEYALARLKHEGYTIAVCSNSIRSSIEMMMEKAALKKYIDLIISNEDVKNAKPDPEIYLNAYERLSLKPEQCVILEDNKNGIKAAKDSGGNVLEIGDISDVNYWNIANFIKNL